MRTAPFARAADVGWSNGSARRPKPEIMRLRLSGMRTEAVSVLWPVASQNGSALDLPMRKRWMATVPFAAVRSSAHSTRPMPIGSPSTVYSCSYCTQKSHPL